VLLWLDTSAPDQNSLSARFSIYSNKFGRLEDGGSPFLRNVKTCNHYKVQITKRKPASDRESLWKPEHISKYNFDFYAM